MSADRVMGADAARAVGRFEPDGPEGYRAATAPGAPLRASRSEAVEDERLWLDGEIAPSVSTPVVVVVRHPDFGNEVTLHECGDAAVIDVDLGSCFDASKLGESERSEVADWAQGLRELANHLPLSHPARVQVRETVREIVAERQACDWTRCSRCRCRYDEARGDGYCGLCPACADATDPAECEECGDLGVDPTAKGADRRSVCDDCRDAASEGVVD